MKFNKQTPDYELEAWKEDSEHYLNQLKNVDGMSKERHAALTKSWQETLINANAEIESRKQSK
jgi:hypothetical protein